VAKTAQTVQLLSTLYLMNELLRSFLSGDASDMSLSPTIAGDVTQFLTRWNAKNPEDQAKLLDLLYPELKRIAEGRMRRERPDHTLQATALVNEFVVRLCTVTQQPWQNRLHFLAIASRAMRRILVDHARAHNSEKRGGADCKVQLEGSIAEPRPFQDILEIHHLLERLSVEDPRMANVVELRYFGGLSNGEVAETLGVAERTVKRDWQVARAWLYAQMHRRNPDAS
jgi:RNA polymerase sigma factor (TIGR02999 family)